MTFPQAAVWTGRSERSLIRLYQRGKLTSHGKDDRGRVLLDFFAVCKLGAWREPAPGQPSELLAA